MMSVTLAIVKQVACVKAVLLCKGCVAVRRGVVMVDRVFCAACAIRGVGS